MRIGNIFWGVILIVLGGLFFLQASGMITDVLGWFWPVFLILLGAWVLGQRFFPRLTRGGQSGTFSIPLQGATKVDVDFDHGAGAVVFSAGAPAGIAMTGSQANGVEVKSSLKGDTLAIDLDAGPTFLPFLGPDNGEWRFQLSGEVPVSIKVDAGASSMDFDMTGVKLAFLGVDTGASSLRVKLPAGAGQTLLSVESGAASIDISVPIGVAARIRAEQGASSMSIDQARFPLLSSAGGLYQSADYDSAANRVEINLDGGANSVNVH
jgi:hypothetical protein